MFLVTPNHPQAIRFGEFGGDLGDLFSRPGADGGDQSGLVEDPPPQFHAELLDILCGRIHQPGGLTEGLIEGELFEHRHHGPDGVEHPAAGGAVDRSARRQHHCRHTDEATGLMYRHRRSRAEDPGLIARTGHHSPAAQTSDQDGTPTQGGPGQLLDGREERVHVEVQHPARHIRLWRSPPGHRHRSPPGPPVRRSRSPWPGSHRRSGRSAYAPSPPARPVPTSPR